MALEAMFTVDQLERWVALEWPDVWGEIGAARAMSKKEYVFRVCEILEGHGCITDRFFDRLQVARPRRSSEIEALHGGVRARQGDATTAKPRAILLVNIEGPDNAHRIEAKEHLIACQMPCALWDRDRFDLASAVVDQAARQVGLASDIVVFASARLLADNAWYRKVLVPADQRRRDGACRLYPVRTSYFMMPPVLFQGCEVLPSTKPLASMSKRADRDRFWLTFWTTFFAG